MMTLYHKYLSVFEKSFYLYISFGILLSSCMGGAAAMVVLMKGFGFVEMFQLFIITCICMGYNTAVLANLKPKTTYTILLISVLLSILVITFNLCTIV
ncbi:MULTISPECIES: hypothetical protein [Galbibacter]|uniref:Uncharacterized protein n=1 Tax=Galbibacter pacificus TaxID=2996052 RepID=A0ABT6FRP8_9FLAO|nr:hypothetical protein [Galbibacter pacificus]MDG3582937.1 hypothetical protein [Galbibacter pacificus]MDG3585944.1 hypothetical protein [Galbibacter pacificus]